MLVAILLATLTAACGESDSIVGVNDVPAELAITVAPSAVNQVPRPAERLVLEAGESIALSVTALNALGLALGDVGAAWSSSNDVVAEIDQAGVVTALSAGAANIFASVDELVAVVEISVIDTVTVPPAPAS